MNLQEASVSPLRYAPRKLRFHLYSKPPENLGFTFYGALPESFGVTSTVSL